jgi:metal-responsive CopG/Arc/MetJ family transcriptional regulator
MPGLSAWLHVYLDNDSCMEVTALQGSSGDANDADLQEWRDNRYRTMKKYAT